MIKVLPKEVSDKIAAGEVIESPVSIVKELIENSIDAGATSISCEIKKGGKEEIRITDNGSGIPKDQVETAFLRHATSKITKAEDLNHLETLGFRGEALASIAAVSRTELSTKTESENTGTRIIIHGGTIISKESIGCPVGTTIVVKDLFYNMPAREKFLKSEAAEAGKIIDMMSRLAITRPDIRFSLISNGKPYFTTLGRNDLKQSILDVYKDREYKDLVGIENDISGLKVFGYISRPSFNRTNRRSQFYFVNGRPIKSTVIDKGVDLGYKERLFEGRHPIVFLFIEADPTKLDVNVHPNKKEVKFNDDISIISAVEEAVRNALTTREGVIKATDTYNVKESNEDAGNTSIESVNKGAKNADNQIDIKSFLSSINRDEDEGKAEVKEEIKLEYSSKVEDSEHLFGKPDLGIEGSKPFDFDDLEFGQTVFGTYIVATDSESLYLFDQHAAHERVNYEKFIKAYLDSEKDSQIILVPFTFDVPLEMTEEDNWLTVLNNMGYEVERFGDNTYIVRAIPIFVTLAEAEEFINSFVDSFSDDLKTKNQIVIDKLITKACKSSIKANDYIKDEEITALIDELKLCDNPFSCPHGRPTFIKFSKYEIERMFKRT